MLSPECNGCLDCIETCPVKGALSYTFAGKSGSTRYLLPALMLGLFALAILSAIVTGFWDSSVSLWEVMYYFPMLDQI